MNIYLFELKAQAKSFLIWTIVIVFFLIIFMGAMYPVFYDSMDDITAMLQNFPPEFAAAFGVHLEEMFSYGGFFSFTFLYLSLVGAIMAVTLAVSSFAREKRSKCMDFLLTKPRSRRTIFTAKLLSGLTLLIVTNLFFIAAALLSFAASGEEQDSFGRFLLGTLSLFPTQLVFYAIGILFAILAKKVRSVSGAATAIGFAGFILTALNGMLEEEFIRYIDPLEYYDPTAVFAAGGYEVKFAVTGLIVIAACVLISYAKFKKSDAHAV
jgi:ABC-2 type transport system permease protein